MRKLKAGKHDTTESNPGSAGASNATQPTGTPKERDAAITRVLLVDDHALVRAGIRELLEKIPGIQVVAEAANGRDALDQIEPSAPDLILMDVRMPGLNGLEALVYVPKNIPVIFLTMYANEEYAIRAMQNGAAGYLLKDSAAAELERAVAAVLKGEKYVVPALAHKVEEYLSCHPPIADPLAALTRRQREVLQLIAEGKNTKEIALALSISSKTVEMHRGLLMERLQIHEVAGLVRYAISAGLVELPPRLET